MREENPRSLRITLVNNSREIYPPLGLCYLSAALKKKGVHSISLVDRWREDNQGMVNRILRTEPHIIGMSTYSVGFDNILDMCSMLRNRAPKIPVIWGGPHITSLPESLPPEVDVGVIGEGEETFIELADGYASSGKFEGEWLASVKGISFRDGDKVRVNERRLMKSNLDHLPLPDYLILDMDWYTAPKRFLVMKGIYRGTTIISSRGCPYRCIYCQASRQWELIRYHSPEYVVENIRFLRSTYPRINAINIVDDLFTANRARLEKIVEMVRSEGLHRGISFNVNSRANLVDEESLKLLKAMNVVQIGYGFESNSPGILSYLKKNTVTVEDNERAAKLTNNYCIGVGGQFMLGTPGETRDDIMETIRFIRKFRMSHAHLSITTPLPGTELWEDAKRKGFVAEQMNWRILDFGNPANPDLIYTNEAMSKDEFDEMKKKMQEACKIHNAPISLYDLLQIALGKAYLLIRLLKNLVSAVIQSAK
ncbi:MAG: radical SAM protein [bacterium]